jgi:hypothetical protein
MCEMNDREIATNALALIGAIASAHAEQGWGNPLLYQGLEAGIHLAEHLDNEDELVVLLKSCLIEMGEAVAENEARFEKIQELIENQGLTDPA